MRANLAIWQRAAELTAFREEKSLTSLPAEERAVWQQFWIDLAVLRGS